MVGGLGYAVHMDNKHKEDMKAKSEYFDSVISDKLDSMDAKKRLSFSRKVLKDYGVDTSPYAGAMVKTRSSMSDVLRMDADSVIEKNADDFIITKDGKITYEATPND